MATGLVFHEQCMWHDAGNAASFIPAGDMVQPDQHAEEPETKRRIKNLIEVSGLVDKLELIKAVQATDEQIYSVHDKNYIERVTKISLQGGGEVGLNTFLGRAGFEIAKLSAGGCISLFDAVACGRVENGYALVRPPGHHARPDEAMGFCILSNAGIAIRHLQQEHQLERIAVVDWDAHHGNGTEEIFYEDPGVLTISIHQDNLFPIGTGSMDSRGSGAGYGYNINVPLPAGSGIGAYISTFQEIVEVALRAYKPQLIVVTSGFDACALDPLARLMLNSDAYRQLTTILKELAIELCEGRIAMTHEGGYSRAYTPFCGLAVMEVLSGENTGVEDPFNDYIADFGGQELQPHQAEVINSAKILLKDIS